MAPSVMDDGAAKTPGIARNISPPKAIDPSPFLRPTDRADPGFPPGKFVGESGGASVRQSTLAENQIRIPNESGVTGLYHRFPVG
jgi:hypothetical protein